MPIELTCSCGKRLQVAEEHSGRQGKCPACGGILQIPARPDAAADVPPSASRADQAAFASEDLPDVPPIAGFTPELHETPEPIADSEANGELTPVGCVLTLLSVAVISVVALPIVRWRDPEFGQPLPRMIAIVAPILIGAIVQAIGTFVLRLLGLRVWKKRKPGAKW